MNGGEKSASKRNEKRLVRCAKKIYYFPHFLSRLKVRKRQVTDNWIKA